MSTHRIEIKASEGSTQWDDPHFLTVDAVMGSETILVSEQYPSKGGAKRAGKRLREVTNWDLVIVEADGSHVPVPLDDTEDMT